MKKLIFYPFYAYAMKIYHKDRDYEKANKFYQIAERFYPNHTENLFKIGMCYKKCRNYREASKYFEKALELDPENEKYKEQLQIARMRDFILFAPTKLWWQEIIALEQKIQEKGEKYELLLNLAEDCLAMRHYDKAAKAYQRAIALCKEKERLPQLYYEMGYAYENVADEAHLRLAKEAYAYAIDLDEELESKRYGIGVFHCAKERWRFANRAFLEKAESPAPRHCEDDRTKQSIIPHTCDSTTASLRGSETNEAIHNTESHFKDSIAKASDCRIIDCHENQRFSRNDESQPVIASASEAIHNQAYFKDSLAKTKGEISDNGLPQPLTRLRNDAVADALDSRHCEQSEASVAKATDPHLQIHNQAYFQDSTMESKEARFQSIDCHDSLRNLTMTQSHQTCHCEDDRTKQSIISHTCDSTLTRATKPTLICTDDLLLNKIGESFERLYDWENALKYYQQSLELNYQNPQTHLRLGFVYERIGNYQQAVESYTQGLQRNNALNTYWVYRLGFCLNQLGEFQEASKILLSLRVTDAYPLVVGGGGELYDKCLAE